MKVRLILPALEEARSEYWRSIKYSLFPPLGLGLLAGYLDPADEVEIVDEHVRPGVHDDAPDLVAIEVYITCARRAYELADGYRKRGSHVVLGGLHPTALPDEALLHCDTLVTGPAEEAWPRFLADFRAGRAAGRYVSRQRDLSRLPPIRRDLFDRRRYLVPDSLVVSRGCPHDCDFCYKGDFFRGGSSFYLAGLDWALRELEAMRSRHVFFLDDNIFGDRHFAGELFGALRGMNRVWQGAATVASLQEDRLLDRAVDSGLRSLFVGFESLSDDSLRQHGKRHNRLEAYDRAIVALHDRGVMINASFVFGMESDDPAVFERTVDWAVSRGLETATFHILTPYPGSALHRRYEEDNRLVCTDWDRYDTRHMVFRHDRMDAGTLERGYREAYRQFYSWRSIWRSATTKPTLRRALRHFVYTAAWKKMDPLWQGIIALKSLPFATPLLENLLDLAAGTPARPKSASDGCPDAGSLRY